MTEIIHHDEQFSALTVPNAFLTQLATGMLWAEGPVYFPLGNYVLWSDIPNNRIMQWIDGLGVRTFRHPSQNANGNTRDLEGRLITCEHLMRRVTRTEHDGSIIVIADSFQANVSTHQTMLLSNRMARSGLPIRPMGSSATMKANALNRNSRVVLFIAVILRPGRSTSWQMISKNQMGWRFHQTKRYCMSPIPVDHMIQRGLTIFVHPM